jgi:hypothetical protein
MTGVEEQVWSYREDDFKVGLEMGVVKDLDGVSQPSTSR